MKLTSQIWSLTCLRLRVSMLALHDAQVASPARRCCAPSPGGRPSSLPFRDRSDRF